MNGNLISLHAECRLGIIADDLTGACDTGVQFAIRGVDVLVWLKPESLKTVSAELTVITTESRNDVPEVARQKVQQACEQLAQNRVMLFYKKIDSTLQGNVGAEVDAVLDAWEFPLAVITPAFPAQERRLIDGWLRLPGVPLIESIHLPTLLREQSTRRVAHLNSSALRNAPLDLLEALRQVNTVDKPLVAVDAASDADLTQIARAAMEFTPRPLMVGSAGLAVHIATVLAEKAHIGERRAVRSSDGIPDDGEKDRDHRPIVIFAGSQNPITARQVKKLKDARPVDELQLRKDAQTAAKNILRERRHLFVPVHWIGDEARHLSNELSPLFAERSVHGLVTTGGDTTSLVLGTMGAQGIRLEGEILTGIPWGRVVGGHAEGLAICTKAGGFGDEDALVVVTDFLARRNGR